MTASWVTTLIMFLLLASGYAAGLLIFLLVRRIRRKPEPVKTNPKPKVE